MRRYQCRTGTIKVTLVLYVGMAIIMWFLDGNYKYLAFIWVALFVMYFYRYRSFSRHGYIEIADHYLTINYANWRGIKKIDFKDIEELTTKKISYVLTLKTGKKRYIYTENIAKSDLESFREDMGAINYSGKEMVHEIYLVRHGLLDDNTFLLDDRGKQLSNELIDLFAGVNFDFIASSTEVRCIDTITPISKHQNLQINTYDKNDFTNLKPLQDALIFDNSVALICYRIEEINFILDYLKIEQFDENTRNSAYEKILHLALINGETTRNPDIPTGHKKMH